jgi:large conductance mechanosensitive channel
MLTGFREFIVRGNVLDLAVAVVIGAAFTAVVTTIVTALINPAIGALFSAESLATALPVVISTVSGGETVLYFGAVVGALLNFLIVAAVVYFALVVPVNHLKHTAEKRRQAGLPVSVEAAPPTELELLIEIRDLLAHRGAAQ